MARVTLDDTELTLALQAKLRARAELALQIYTDEALKYDDPSYRFRRHEDERSIRDPESQEIIDLPGVGIRIQVTSPGARYIEEGNKPHGGGQITSRTKGLLALPTRGGSVLMKYAVDPYPGTHRLENAVKRAFGVRV